MKILFPIKCGICNRFSDEYLCKKCEIQFRQKCISEKIIYLSKEFDRLIYYGKYTGMLKQKLSEYKFKENIYLYKLFTKLLLNNKKITKVLNEADYIIYIPMYKSKYKKRGYNQTELIVKEICRNIKFLECLEIIIKTKNTKTQNKLNKENRKINILGAFSIKKEMDLSNKNIVVFDDIYTTGSTVEECSKLLRKMNAKEISVITIAKD